MKSILFICTANAQRSYTAQIYFQNKYPEQRFRSAGVNKYFCHRDGGVYLEKYMLDSASRIVCMESVHKDIIIQRFGDSYNNLIEVLELRDTENFMSHGLINMLLQKFKI